MDFNVESVQLKNEEQKFARLALTFLYKTMEAIYFVRCPNQADFTDEDTKSAWFNLNIPRSNSLRQKLQSTFYHGWFSVDISLADPIKETNTIIERWYLIHIPVKQTETLPSLNSNLKDLKFHTYRRFTQILRSIFSLLNALPSTTLSIVLKQLTTTKKKLVASVSGFQKFPAQIAPLCEEETAKLRFGPIVTPIGQSVVICHYRLDLTSLIPTPIRTAPRIKPQENEMEQEQRRQQVEKMHQQVNNMKMQNESILMSSNVKDTYGMSVPSNSSIPFMMTPNSHINIQSFIPNDALGQFEPFEPYSQTSTSHSTAMTNDMTSMTNNVTNSMTTIEASSSLNIENNFLNQRMKGLSPQSPPMEIGEFVDFLDASRQKLEMMRKKQIKKNGVKKGDEEEIIVQRLERVKDELGRLRKE